METVAGITYSKPEVVLLQETGIGTSEYAARTCYDSFDVSENECVRNAEYALSIPHKDNIRPIEVAQYMQWNKDLNDIEHSDLLDQLAWTHFHYSILEHANLTYLIKGTSRGVLQEHARHRLQAISVRSTRYTLSPVINAFVAEILTNVSNTYPSDWFISTLLEQDLFVTNDKEYNVIQIINIFNCLKYQFTQLGKEHFMHLAVAKSSLSIVDQPNGTYQDIYDSLEAGKRKRNVADNFKHIINDNFKVDMVVTFNLRSLKNYFQLRSSGAAWFQIQWLAEEMKQATPQKYLDLIVKGNKY